MPGIEVLLPVGAIAFYLYDSAHLLYSNERLITCVGRRWSMAGSAGLFLMGRTVYAPGLLLPHRPLFRLAWPVTTAATSGVTSALGAFLAALRPVQIVVWLLLALLVAALPLVSWHYGAGPHMLAVFIAYYCLLLLALSIIFVRRTALGLTGRAFGGLLFDVCACAPFGVNLVSKLSLRRCLANDPLHAELLTMASQVNEVQA
jgi:hypothetical protein